MTPNEKARLVNMFQGESKVFPSSKSFASSMSHCWLLAKFATRWKGKHVSNFRPSMEILAPSIFNFCSDFYDWLSALDNAQEICVVSKTF